MENCKPSVEITMRATFLDVTPEGGGTSVRNEATTAEAPVFTAAPSGEDAAATDAGGVDAALVAAGEGAFRQCSSCHQVGEGARNGVGPHLNGLVGRSIGAVDGFRYSNVLLDAHDAGQVWSEEALAAFLADPRGAMPGTKMAFRGVQDEADITALIAYLGTLQAE